MSLPSALRQQILTNLCEFSEEGVFIADDHLHFLWVNNSFERLVGLSFDYLYGRPLHVYPLSELNDEYRDFAQRAKQALTSKGYFKDDFCFLTSYQMTINANITIWQVECSQYTYFVGLLRDISDNAKTELSLFQLRNYNPTTKLPNRHFFMTQLSDFIVDTYQELAVVRLNIDRFSSIASGLSETTVLSLLQQLVERIHKLELPNLKVFAHFSADDFAMLFECDDADLVRNDLDKIMQTCELPFAVDGESLYLQLSIGVSKYPVHGRQMDMLYRAAERALQHVKNHGGDDILWYEHSLQLSILPDLKLEAQLRQAIKRQEFVPYYQPKIHLKTGKLVGFEALVRWRHPTRGLLQPEDFLQTIIENNLTFDLFCQMTQSVIEQINDWQAQNFFVEVCLNADTAEFCHPHFLPFIRYMLSNNPTCQDYLQIEMTESSLITNNAVTTEVLCQLKALGISLALDDFGTGYASLSYLHHYPFDCIKIDKSFIDNIVDNHKHLSIVQAIISLAHSLDMTVISEGVENEQQAQLLTSGGCEFAQGYFFGKPVDAQTATKLLLSEHLD